MKILITGLTLHNNKGGPALALSLIEKLRDVFKKSQFYLSVPDFANNIELEKKWANYYSIDGVIGSVGIKEMLYINKNKRGKFENFFKNVDLVVDLHALSYMDLSHLSYKGNLVRNLSIYTIRYFSNKFNIPCIRWTQSYGPFNSYITKKLVRMDLKNQKNIFVRGESSLTHVQKIFKNKGIYSFPDIAITLKYKTSYYQRYLKDKKYVTLSPSSVIYSKDGYVHIKEFREIIDYIKRLNYKIVMIPHNRMSINPSLYNCDLKVSEKILENIKCKDNIHLVKEDLDVYDLKGIIANAVLHIGARYHSIVASLSTSVPTIAFSWHEKYKDIMKMYKMEKYIYNENSDLKIIFDHINNLEKNRDKIISCLRKQQIKLEKKIDKNLELFMENFYEM